MFNVPVLILVMFKSVQGTTETAGNGENKTIGLQGLTLKSTMLDHVLSWRPMEIDGVNVTGLRYTVLYRMETYRSWENIPQCSDIATLVCDFGDLEMFTDSDYWFKVSAKFPGSPDEVYTSSTLMFRPERDTNLLHPNITAKYADGYIFVRPDPPKHQGNGEDLSQHMPGLKYEIRYWPGNLTDDAQNVSTAGLTDREISFKVDRHVDQYCIIIRLYGEVREDELRTIISNWSTPPVCVRPEAPDLSVRAHGGGTRVTSYISAGIACLIILIGASYAICRGMKMYKFINKKEPFPPSLAKLFQESADQTITAKTHYSDSEEIIDDIFYPMRGTRHQKIEDYQPHRENLDGGVKPQSLPGNGFYSQEGNLQFAPKQPQFIGLNTTANNSATAYDVAVDHLTKQQHQTLSLPQRMKSLPNAGIQYRNEQSRASEQNQPKKHRKQRYSELIFTANTDKDVVLPGVQIRSPHRHYLNEESEGMKVFAVNLFNASYSSNPNRRVPDLLHTDYINVADL